MAELKNTNVIKEGSVIKNGLSLQTGLFNKVVDMHYVEAYGPENIVLMKEVDPNAPKPKQLHLFTVNNEYHADNRVFDTINKYRGTLEFTNAILSGPAGEEGAKDENGNLKNTPKIIYNQIASPSLFNPYYSLLAGGVTPNVPLLDTHKNGTDISATASDLSADIINRKIIIKPTDDCSIKNLVELSKLNHGPLGQARYKYSDFMYCNDLGKVSNNHLITLRKFDSPVRDNIFHGTTIDDDGNFSIKGDVGRLITWFGTEDNKLEDILKYSYNASWKELEAKIQTKESQEDDDARGIVGNIINLFNPEYNKYTERGISPSSLGFILGTSSSDAFYTAAPYANNPAVNGSLYDANRVYEPKDTIRNTYTYEGKLSFEHEFSLTFKYKLRGYDNINAKTAFLDLLANILSVTYRQGTFWGGEQRIIGSPQNKSGWKKAEEFVDNGLEAGGTLISSILKGGDLGDSVDAFVNSIAASISNIMGGNFKLPNTWGEAAKLLSAEATKAEILKGVKGSLHDSLGRPAIYAFDSLLTNDAVGLWHVTIGNPLNPIVSMGNLILTNAEITHSGPLGLDDFPTELTVTVSLKHGMPRDSVDIQKMYTQGRNSIHTKISNYKNFKFLGVNNAYEAIDQQYKDWEKKREDLKNGKVKASEAAVQKLESDYRLDIKEINIEGASSINASNASEFAGWIGDGEIMRIISNKESLK